MSANGRFVAYESRADNIVAGDTNGVKDIFVHDRQAGTTIRASVTSGGLQADGASDLPSISADGRYVAFRSLAGNLVPGESKPWADAYVRDLVAGTTVRVSVSSTGERASAETTGVAISGNGRYVAFTSRASNLVNDDYNGGEDVFVHDLLNGNTVRASVTDTGAYPQVSHGTSISYDGRRVAFWARTVFGGASRIFVRDLDTGRTIPVTADDTGPASYFSPAISGDGKRVVFHASRLHVRDLDSGNLFSLADWTNALEQFNPPAAINGDGRIVAFSTNHSDVLPQNIREGVLLWNVEDGTYGHASIPPAGGPIPAQATRPSLSSDGQFLAFDTGVRTGIRYRPISDVYVRSLGDSVTARVSIAQIPARRNADASSEGMSISADGRRVAFTSLAGNLVTSDTNAQEDVFVYDRDTGLTTRASLGPDGSEGDGPSHSAGISPDGRFVGFQSAAVTFSPFVSENLDFTYLRDLLQQTTTLVSVSAAGLPVTSVYAPSVSEGGRYVAWVSRTASSAADDLQVYVTDVANGRSLLVSEGFDGLPGNNRSGPPRISRDGRFIAFTSFATNLVQNDTNGHPDVFLRDMSTGETRRLNVSPEGVQANLGSEPYLSISDDGRFIAFSSGASNLVKGIDSHKPRVYIHDRVAGATDLAGPAAGEVASWDHGVPSIGHSGRFVAFGGISTEWPRVMSLFVHDRMSGRVQAANVADDGLPRAGSLSAPALSEGGLWIAWSSNAPDMAPGPEDSLQHIYLRGPLQPGDVTDDGYVTHADAALLLRLAAGLAPADALHVERGDLGGSGNLTIADAVTLLRQVHGL